MTRESAAKSICPDESRRTDGHKLIIANVLQFYGCSLTTTDGAIGAGDAWLGADLAGKNPTVKSTDADSSGNFAAVGRHPSTRPSLIRAGKRRPSGTHVRRGV